jgi:lipopolysaccharide/colanic/teichoic acid biosynthesis glycosyltransferase
MSESLFDHTADSQSASELHDVAGRRLSYLESPRKRYLDVLLSFIGLVVTAIVLLPMALIIKISSRGPVFYHQTRLGLGNEKFKIVKFRSMKIDAESDGVARWAQKDDDRVTWFGKIMRATYLDELPQAWNVFKGDMSIVGPRPERPELASQIRSKLPTFDSRTSVKPGITGLAQIYYRYGRDFVDARNKLRYDQRYIGNASLTLDLWIILRTVLHVFSRPGT